MKHTQCEVNPREESPERFSVVAGAWPASEEVADDPFRSAGKHVSSHASGVYCKLTFSHVQSCLVYSLQDLVRWSRRMCFAVEKVMGYPGSHPVRRARHLLRLVAGNIAREGIPSPNSLSIVVQLSPAKPSATRGRGRRRTRKRLCH